MKPSISTVASAAGGLVIGVPVADVLQWLVSLAHLEMPTNVHSGIAVLVSVLCGYLFPGGKSNDIAKPDDDAPGVGSTG